MINDDEKTKKKMINIAWAASSIVFTCFIIYVFYIAKIMKTANGDTPPWWAMAVFDIAVVSLLRIAIRDKFKR